MAVKLSARMSALAALVTPGVRLADVGTDHGYIPVFPVSDGGDPLCHSDGCEPWASAESRGPCCGISAWEDRIQTRLSDGLEKLAPGGSGLCADRRDGGRPDTADPLRKAGRAVQASEEELILQPQSEVPSDPRRFLQGAWIPDRGRGHGGRGRQVLFSHESAYSRWTADASELQSAGGGIRPGPAAEKAPGPAALDPAGDRYYRKDPKRSEGRPAGCVRRKSGVQSGILRARKGRSAMGNIRAQHRAEQKKLMERLFQIEEEGGCCRRDWND